MINILVVEDDGTLNQIVCTYLNDSGFQAKGCLSVNEAYEEMLKTEDTAITDDAMVLERIKGKKSKLIEGSYRNIKITTPEDLLIANVYLQHPE